MKTEIVVRSLYSGSRRSFDLCWFPVDFVSKARTRRLFSLDPTTTRDGEAQHSTVQWVRRTRSFRASSSATRSPSSDPIN